MKKKDLILSYDGCDRRGFFSGNFKFDSVFTRLLEMRVSYCVLRVDFDFYFEYVFVFNMSPILSIET